MTWTIIPDASVRATERLSWLVRLRYLLRHRTWAPRARVAITDERAGTIRTHPDNVAAVASHIDSLGRAYKVAAPTLRTVTGGRK